MFIFSEGKELKTSSIFIMPPLDPNSFNLALASLLVYSLSTPFVTYKSLNPSLSKSAIRGAQLQSVLETPLNWDDSLKIPFPVFV